MDTLADRLLAGEQRALSRLISMLERGDPAAAEVMQDIDGHTGRAYTLGITGPPGAGKSTIVDQLTRLLREQDQRVGIVAVDPTSPFSGGALLGDRIRMQRHYLDSGVFIRSVATRGQAGGLPRIVKGIARALGRRRLRRGDSGNRRRGSNRAGHHGRSRHRSRGPHSRRLAIPSRR